MMPDEMKNGYPLLIDWLIYVKDQQEENDKGTRNVVFLVWSNLFASTL